ncbi:MAG: T9SS C-terminal target domain-containing protein [Crocinitomicaceae bacterium]|nr:T9SS C-terminal target domain-containing protein [Crocinitomicaceae bacterium]
MTNLYNGCPKVTAVLNQTNGIVLKNSAPITLSATPSGGVFSGYAISNGQFTPAKANLGSNTVDYHFTNNGGCKDSTQFKVIVYDTLGTVCSSTDTLKIKLKLTAEINSNQYTNLSVYPNPTADVLIIDAADVKLLSGYSYKVLDLQGKELYNAPVLMAKTEIALNKLGAKGVYLLHIVNKNGTSIENKKIVLE